MTENVCCTNFNLLAYFYLCSSDAANSLNDNSWLRFEINLLLELLKVHLTPFSFFLKMTCCILWSFSPNKYFDLSKSSMEMSKIAIKCRHVRP